MKSSNWLGYILITLTVVATCCAFKRHNRNSPLFNYSVRDTLAIEVNPWQPYLSIPFDDSINV